MPAVMVQGCTSWAGKSWLTTALCRWYARTGRTVAPFKSQNMSNNARVVVGGEIGVAQWLQATAARVTPELRHNPILVKPEGGGSQVVRMGVVDQQMSQTPWEGRSDSLWPTMEAALVDLLESHDLVVIEGAGSPAEINLARHDLTNMKVAERADAPVLLVVDIDRGGAFAHLYGTWALLPPAHQARIAGFVLNRFRGNAALLSPGPAQLRELTGVPTIGVIPMVEHDLPDEDGGATHREPRRGAATVAILRAPSASNLDEYTTLAQVARIKWATSPHHLSGADLVVLPGSKHVARDLAWLRSRDLDTAVAAAATAGTRVLGICGGMQILGQALHDPHHLDGAGEGLGLLPITTTFNPTKVTIPTAATFAGALPSPWSALNGLQVDGYEIRHGHSTSTNDDHGHSAVRQGAQGWAKNSVLGVSFHGLLESADALQRLLGVQPEHTLDDAIDELADLIDTHLDTDLLTDLAGAFQ